MFCPQCGTENTDNTNYCKECGHALTPISSTPEKPVGHPQYDIDDLYFAAINGKVTEAANILKYQPQLLNEKYKTQTDDGITIEATTLFSIIAHYSDRELNTAVMDELVKAGSDFNQRVKLSYPNERYSSRSLLYYPIAVWNNLELAKYLLEHGADPNVMVYENTDSESFMTSYLPLLFYAIIECEGTEMMELLLTYGANPGICCEPFVDEFGIYQKLPMMVYAVTNETSIEKTACLIRYGASPQDTVNLGKGYKKVNSVYGYVKMGYPNKTAVIDAALIQAKKLPVPYVKNVYAAMYGNRQPAQQGNNVPGAQQNARPHNTDSNIQQPVSVPINTRINDKINKKCYNRFVAYLFANFSILGIGFGIIGPLLGVKKGAEFSGGLLLFGIPCLLIAALIGFLVYITGKNRGQQHFFGEFITDSIVVYAKVMMYMSIILIPFAISIGRGSGNWSDRKTTDGMNVTVQNIGSDEYRDALGNRYIEKDDE